MEEILGKAIKEEKQDEWLKAADFYQKVLTTFDESDFLRKGEVRESLAHAIYKAAFQADTKREFKERMTQTVAQYELAKRNYEKSSDPGRVPRISRCEAMTALAAYWLAVGASEKKKSIDECWRLTNEALRTFKEAGDAWEYGRTYDQLSKSVSFGIDLDWNCQTRKKTLAEAIEQGEQAIKFLSSFEDSEELARAYVLVAVHQEPFSDNFLDGEQKKSGYRKAAEYWRKACQISESTAVIEYFSSVSTLSGLSGWQTDEGDSTESICEEALKLGKKAKDRFIIGGALDRLVYITYWKAYAIDDPNERVALYKRALQCAEEARSQFSIPSFISSRGGAFWVEAPLAAYYWELAKLEPVPNRRHDLLKKSMESAQEALERAEYSGYPEVRSDALYRLSDILSKLGGIGTSSDEKRRLFEKALKYKDESIEIIDKLQPCWYWNQGITRSARARIKSELAGLANDPESRNNMLLEAVIDKEKAVNLLHRHIQNAGAGGGSSLLAMLGQVECEYGSLLNNLYGFTGNKEHGEKAVEAFQGALASFQKLALESRVAECYWKIGQTYRLLSEHIKAADNFELASNSYAKATGTIPHLRSFFQEYASYMQAWAEIERARQHHIRQEFGLAKENFVKAANLHESLKKWNYLSSNYRAWAQLEDAEESSRREQSQEAIQAFEQANELFNETGKSLRAKLDEIQDMDEKEMATSMLKATELRQEYCKSRIAIEEAKTLDKIGDHYSSSEKYGLAAEMLEKIIQKLESEQDRKEIRYIISLSKAWQKMTLAESEASPELYLDASDYFEEAKESSPNEKAKMLALGHSRFCRALEAGTRFSDTRDVAMHSGAMQHLESAANYYLRAGFENASRAVRATKLLFDAYVHMDNAAKENDLEKKAKLYAIAEKLLQTSMDAFAKTDNPSKKEQILKLLETVREERELAVSLAQVLQAPILTSTANLPSPAPTYEQAVGIERFEHAEVQANVIIGRRELRVGEILDLEIELTNAGKGTALLDSIAEAIPDGFEVEEKPEVYRVEGCNINMKGKKLDPLKVEEVRFSLEPKREGSFTIRPRILYLDENGKCKVSEADPMALIVNEPVPESSETHQNLVDTGFAVLDKLLYGGIAANSAVVLASTPCDEKASLIRSFLKTGMNRKQTTFYVTAKTSGLSAIAEESQSDFCLFICNPQADVIIGNRPDVFKLKDVENLTEINIALSSALNKLTNSSDGNRRICIDIVSDVLLQHHALNTRRWLNALIPQLKSKGFTVLAVLDPGMHRPEDVHAILDIFDGEISIYEKETGKGLGRFLRILRMQDQEYSKDETRLDTR